MRIITFTLLVAFFVGLLSLSSCNTVRGVGQDLQKGGQAIEDATK